MAEETLFSWVAPYAAIANKLLEKRDQEAQLLGICARHANMEGVKRIDPFTVMSLFNRQIKDENRRLIISDILETFGLSEQAPEDFAGVPLSNNQRWRYMDGVYEHIDAKWDFFECAAAFVQSGSDDDAKAFTELFDEVLSHKNVGLANLTIALFWCWPDAFLPLDANTVTFLSDAYFIKVDKRMDGKGYLELLDTTREKTPSSFREISYDAWIYDGWGPLPSVFDPGLSKSDWKRLIEDDSIFTAVSLRMLSCMDSLGGASTCKELANAFGETFGHYNAVGAALGERVALALDIPVRTNQWGGNQYWSVPFLGKAAEKDQEGKFSWKIRPELHEALLESGVLPSVQTAKTEPRHWVYSPGNSASQWSNCLEQGIMVLGWDELGDLAAYASREEMAKRRNEISGEDSSHKNSTLACWDFQHSIRPGDIIYAKRGVSKVIGRGIVESDAYFDDAREYYKHVRKVNWTDSGEWDPIGFSLPMKTLTELGNRPERDALIALFDAPTETSMNDDNVSYWWLNASPKIWSYGNIAIGDEQTYTIFNERGRRRRIPRNFMDAKTGDIVIGYEATPVKAIVAICEISRDHDEEFLYFKKVRDLDEPVPYNTIKESEALANMEFMRNPNGSLFKLTPEEFTEIEELISSDSAPELASAEIYTDEDFLGDVFVDEKALAHMKALLSRKKNLILQGSPGTGKTFAAKRLAWCLMGEKASNRIEIVQFHQSSTYDEFVIGYRPSDGGGFEVQEGVFARFCRKAAADPNNNYYLIIDEINRANISKVLGELLMLIEADHRGESLTLAVGSRKLSVPENLYIIGMMNTADRGLALIDYALRRRFAFFEMQPALSHPGFLEQVEDEQMLSLIKATEKLNDKIAKDPTLGSGFRIGHSYFCGADDAELVLEYELKPLINEYWFDDADTAKSEIQKLEDALK